MNHSLPYSDTSFGAVKQSSSKSYNVYDAVVAAIADINLTVPAHRRVILDYCMKDNYGSLHALHVKQGENTLCTYEIDIYPHLIRRMWTHITLGLADADMVETIKGEIIATYQY
ncbi:hypothetical protein H6768_05255 [Candidatus Peribacteria bacterium]|nr:hypothetical protein [Candidatus Peribacteria bacterium]